MSSGQKPRTPRYYPTMKVRGKRRRRIAGFYLLTGTFDRLEVSAKKTAESMKNLMVVWKNE